VHSLGTALRDNAADLGILVEKRDSSFDENRIALLIIQRPSCSSVAKVVRHFSGNHDYRTLFGREPLIASLHFESSFEDVIELLVPIVDMQRSPSPGSVVISQTQ
jgi:hypothetical protein